MIWILVLVIYHAPSDAIDWEGPWTYGTPYVVERSFDSEAACSKTATQTNKNAHEGMRAPIRYHCIQVPAGLPKGAPR